MQFSLLSLLLFFGMIWGGRSAVFLERQRTLPGHEGQCFDKADNAFYKIGEEMKWKKQECGRKVCLGSRGGQVYIEIQTCGTVGVPPGCYTKANLALPYPDCCEKIICRETTGSPQIIL